MVFTIRLGSLSIWGSSFSTISFEANHTHTQTISNNKETSLDPANLKKLSSYFCTTFVSKVLFTKCCFWPTPFFSKVQWNFWKISIWS